MSNIIFTATGCTRCKIAKSFMEGNGISFVEKNMKEEGKEDFQRFYKSNRKHIYRGPDGIEFPIFTDGVAIRQGIGAVIAYLHSGNKLDGFFSVGTLHKEWVDGIHVSGGDQQYEEEFINVLRYLKEKGMKLQIDTNGKNSSILKRILDEGLADFLVMKVLGPRNLYSKILGEKIDLDEVETSIKLASQFAEYRFETAVLPLIRNEGDHPEISYMTPEEIAETAKLIEEMTGSKKNPYLIRLSKQGEVTDELLESVDPLTYNDLFPYRTAARPYQVFTEIDKGN